MNRRVPLHSLVDDVGAGWRPRRRQRRLALAAMALPLVLLLLAEGVVRLALDPVPTLELFVYRSYPDLPERRGDEPVFEGDPLLGWRLRAGLDRVWWDYTPVTTNDAHLRGGPVRPLPEGGRRILCLADSVTFGYRVPVVFPDEQVPAGEGELAYPALLERQLSTDTRPVQALALAVPGYSSHQGRAWLRRDIARYRPDLVTICFGWNDIDLRDAPDHETVSLRPHHLWSRRLIAASRLFGHIARWRVERRGADATPVGRASGRPRVACEDYVANILAMADEARRHGARVVIIAPVYRDPVTNPDDAFRIGRWRAALVRAAGQAGIPCLLVPELTEVGWPHNGELFGEVIHPNEAGHQLLASRLVELIESEGLLDAAAGSKAVEKK